MFPKRLRFLAFSLVFLCSAALAATPVTVRFGKHPTYERIVFDLPTAIGYDVREINGSVRVTFKSPVSIPPQDPAKARLEMVKAITFDANSSTATITAPGMARFRSFISEGNVVIDIYKPKGEAAIQFEGPKPAHPRITNLSEKEAKKAVAERQVEESELAPPAAAAAVEPSATRAPETTPAKTAAMETPRIPQNDIPAVMEETAQGTRIEFLWKGPVQTAVFRRENRHFIVFDQPARLALSIPKPIQNQIFQPVQQLPSETHTILYTETLPGVSPAITRNQQSWVITFRPGLAQPDVIANPAELPNDPSGAHLHLRAEKGGQTVAFPDPVAGDILFAAPIEELGRGIQSKISYVDLELLPSVQGYGGVIRSEGTQVLLNADGFRIDRDQGLRLRREGVDQTRSGSDIHLFRFGDWARADQGYFIDVEKRLMYQIATQDAFKRADLQYELAKFYLAHGFVKESLALLNMMKREYPDFIDIPEAMAVYGTANLLARYYDQADLYLNNPRLNAYNEVYLWRGSLAALQGNHEQALSSLTEAGGIPGGWPLFIRHKLVETAIATALALNKTNEAAAILTTFERTLNERQLKKLTEDQFFTYQTGRILVAQDNKSKALEPLEKAAESEDQFIRTRAEYLYTTAAQDLKKIDDEEAIARLERLRFAWRSPRESERSYRLNILKDDFEFRVLTKLGELYVKTGQFRNALVNLRQAIADFADVRDTSDLARQMREIFIDLFYHGKADRLPPIKAVALFEEFRELTPVDEIGDKMIANLADRMVSVDLLERAQELLEFQVDVRLKGVERSRAASRLALIYLFDRKPEKALDILLKTEMNDLPANLARERRLLKARALFETSQPDLAINTLFNDIGYNSDLLRADIYWRTQQWGLASTVLKRLINYVQDKIAARDLNADKNELRELVLNLSVAMALADETSQLRELKSRYTGLMQNTPYEDLFNLITDISLAEGNSTEIGQFSELSSRFSKIDMFERFLNSYRQRLQSDKLSSFYSEQYDNLPNPEGRKPAK